VRSLPIKLFVKHTYKWSCGPSSCKPPTTFFRKRYTFSNGDRPWPLPRLPGRKDNWERKKRPHIRSLWSSIILTQYFLGHFQSEFKPVPKVSENTELLTSSSKHLVMTLLTHMLSYFPENMQQKIGIVQRFKRAAGSSRHRTFSRITSIEIWIWVPLVQTDHKLSWKYMLNYW
jgi:hypothetical protein